MKSATSGFRALFFEVIIAISAIRRAVRMSARSSLSHGSMRESAIHSANSRLSTEA